MRKRSRVVPVAGQLIDCKGTGNGQFNELSRLETQRGPRLIEKMQTGQPEIIDTMLELYFH